MRLYQIPFPATALAAKRADFLHEVLHTCGGYTTVPGATGAWHDPETGVRHFDAIELVQFAIETGQGDAENKLALAHVLNAFKDAFPDEITVMVAEIGTAEIIPNN